MNTYFRWKSETAISNHEHYFWLTCSLLKFARAGCENLAKHGTVKILSPRDIVGCPDDYRLLVSWRLVSTSRHITL